MSTITASGNGSWSSTGTWTGGVVPGNNNTADLGGHTIVMDIATIPASGTLAGLQSTGTAGQLTVNLTTLGGTAAINATTIQAGPTNLISISGTGNITITGGITGGSSSSARGVTTNQTGNLTVVGSVTGGLNLGALAVP